MIHYTAAPVTGADPNESCLALLTVAEARERKPTASAGYRACCSQREKTGGSSNISRWAS